MKRVELVIVNFSKINYYLKLKNDIKLLRELKTQIK